MWHWFSEHAKIQELCGQEGFHQTSEEGLRGQELFPDKAVCESVSESENEYVNM